MNILKGKLLVEPIKQTGIIIPDEQRDTFNGIVSVVGDNSELEVGNEVVFKRGGTRVKIHGIDYIYIDEKNILYVR